MFGDKTPPRVTDKEFKDLRGRLMSKGFDDSDLRMVELVFRRDLVDEREHFRGIDANEIEDAVSWLETHPKHHRLSGKQLEILESELKKEL